mgnify:CR=1 FL=1
MRNITIESSVAFVNGANFNKSNTKVINENGKTSLLLHGNCIAIKENNKIKITNCNWSTPTTKERLNGVLYYSGFESYKIYQKKGTWYLNNKEWDGSLISL